MNKQTIRILCIVAVAILLIVTGIVLAVVLPKVKEEINENQESNISGEMLETVITGFISDLKAPGTEDPTFLTEMERSTTVSVKSFEEEDEGFVTAQVVISAPDLYSITKEVEILGALTEEQMDAELTKRIKNATPKEQEITVYFAQMEDGTWKPVVTETFLDTYYGGAWRLRQEALEQYFEKEDVGNGENG